MSGNVGSYIEDSDEVVTCMIRTISLAVFQKFPAIVGEASDIELMIDALRVLRPNLHQLDFFTSVLHVSKGQWIEAIHVLQHLIEVAPEFKEAKSLLVFCLAAANDSSWTRVASEALRENPSAETENLIEAVQAREEMIEARRIAQETGEFVEPPSIQALAQTMQSKNGTPSQAEHNTPGQSSKIDAALVYESHHHLRA